MMYTGYMMYTGPNIHFLHDDVYMGLIFTSYMMYTGLIFTSYMMYTGPNIHFLHDVYRA